MCIVVLHTSCCIYIYIGRFIRWFVWHQQGIGYVGHTSNWSMVCWGVLWQLFFILHILWLYVHSVITRLVLKNRLLMWPFFCWFFYFLVCYMKNVTVWCDVLRQFRYVIGRCTADPFVELGVHFAIQRTVPQRFFLIQGCGFSLNWIKKNSFESWWPA